LTRVTHIGGTVLILGSAPEAVAARDWRRDEFDAIIVINNAWRIRPDWDVLIHPEDFPEDRRPTELGDGQRIVTAADYVPVQNRFGGFVYAGGTMAFTAGYWALGALAPRVLAFFGCNMVYAPQGQTHFYGTGAADPLRADVTLRSLEAKSARLALIAAEAGCRCVNLSQGESRLVFPRGARGVLSGAVPSAADSRALAEAEAREAALGYMVPSGRYWQEEARFDAADIDALDALWLRAYRG
jgi:hypothetical protein